MSVGHPFLARAGAAAMAHRGGAHEAPENTRAAFQHAASLGYLYIESDIQVTRDGVAVLFHDPRLDRVTGASGLVAERTWSQLRSVRTPAGVDQFVRLDEILEAFPDQRFNLDLKCEAAVEPFITFMRDTQSFDRVLASSFSDDRLRRARARLGPDLCTSAGPREVASFLAGSWGIRHRTSGPRALQIPSAIKGVPVVTAALVDHAHERGLEVHIWTIDDEREMNRLLDLGVDGIMTDRPTVLKNVLQGRGSWGGVE